MAIDNKYGKVELEHGTIGEDEPVVVFRATDKVLPLLLEVYHDLCQSFGSPQRHLDLIGETYEKIKTWQDENDTKVPNSEASREWRD